MKSRVPIFASFLMAFCCGGLPAATVGPEVAVVNVRVGKERSDRQIVIGLYDEVAPGHLVRVDDGM